eukprot:COSAG05_NODE_7904_length_757_cov_3.246201_1_plen_74_part_00
MLCVKRGNELVHLLPKELKRLEKSLKGELVFCTEVQVPSQSGAGSKRKLHEIGPVQLHCKAKKAFVLLSAEVS